MAPLVAVIGIVALFIALAFVIARVDNLAFLAPRSSRSVAASAQHFCTDRCRVDGRCPVTQEPERWADCPLFKYVGADMPTVRYGSPFEEVRAA